MFENVNYKISNGRMKITRRFHQVLQASFFPIHVGVFLLYRKRRALSVLLPARNKSGCVLYHIVGFTVSRNGTEIGFWTYM